MQDDTSEEPTSISQLLRESYLAETRTHQNYEEPSKYEPSSDHFYYTNVTESSADVGSSDDFLDLSAFLSEEELDKSVNLAREAIDQTPRETKQQEKKIRVKQPSKSTSNKQVPKPVVSQASSDKGHTQSFRRENVIRGSKSSKESTQDAKKTSKNSPYGCEAEAKKEFLNKAADFIEELSSLFKSQSSKRIRPKALKDHRKKYEAQLRENQPNNSTYPYISESRERAQVSIPEADLNEPESPVQEGIQQTEQSSDQEEIIEGEEEQPPPSPPPSPPSPPPSPPSPPPPPPLPHEVMADIPAESFEYEEFKGMPPVFIQRLKSREVLAGSKVQLDCIVEGNPAPDVRWYCEGKELENSPDIQIITSGQKHSLVIAEAFEEDTGRYSCFASNLYGSDSTSAEIYIEGVSSSDSEGEAQTEDMPQLQRKTEPSVTTLPPSSPAFIHQEVHQSTPIPVQVVSPLPEQQNQSPTNYLQGFDGRPLIAAPVFTKMLQDLTASEGQLVVLESRVKGAPSPKVEWYREGTLIEDSPDFRILQKKPRSAAEPEEICTLVIAEVFPEDSGTFTCTASNKYGTVSSIARLTVKGADEINSNAPKALSTVTVEASHHQLPPILPPSKPQNIPAPEIPSSPKPKLEGVLVNHNEPRSSSKAGLRVHFQLPEDDKGSEASSEEGITSVLQLRSVFDKEMVNGQPLGMPTPTSPTKEPPPVSVKPKLDRGRLKQLHNQVLLEQQQDVSMLQQPQYPSQFRSSASENVFTMNALNSSSSSSMQQSSPSAIQHSKGSHPQAFTYARPKEFIAAQTISPSTERLYSPTDFPVPLPNTAANVPQRQLNENHLETFSPALTSPFELPPLRSLQSPTSAPGYRSPPPLSPPLPFFSSQAQSQSRIMSPTPTSPSGSISSPIQNPAAFLSSVLPSLPSPTPTNAMGLPKSAPAVSPHSILKKTQRFSQFLSEEDIRDSKDAVIHDLERKLKFRDEVSLPNGQQVITEDTMARRYLGPNYPSSVFNAGEAQNNPYPSQDLKYEIESTRNTLGKQQEYKVSSFEQRLMSEIEFRLERTPVEESDDEIQHDDIPKGKCIAPIFDKRLKHFRVTEGTPITFTCKVVGIPVPKVYWFKDGKQISKKNPHCVMKREGDGTCSLSIEACTNDDDGNYTIMAANPQGRISCSGHLMVQSAPLRSRLAPAVQSHRVRTRPTQGEELETVQERFFRPHFLQAPGDMVANEGRLCRLDCKVSGLPTPDLMWLLNGKPLLPGANHKMLVRENGVHSLLIDPLTQNDAGTYTCIATNKAGQSSFNLELTVAAKEVKKAPIFLEKLQNTGIPEGHAVRLECRVVGMPPPVIYWKKDNDTISAHRERVSLFQDATGYVCLMIQPTRKEDAGWYTVSAKNEAGIVSCTARLDIYAQWHQQIPQPVKKVRPSGSRYAALTGQGLDILSAFPSADNPTVHTSFDVVESEEL
ncbi:myopalladin isoform X2 [Protopterus annectens]|uniref:myopalladin isoform X2 n=1 Tax=Protopterus annectens TaxID=7888 RepID=UPI001CF93E2E|nr:myopalladin isoform X2 [Protopterus annectens]